ncbi:hypothetical protein MHU86_5120 [Fragilaria crotonensis]|nr:hypothetical protein MHU86_5120 [Fragilaria crotonensis]
MSHSVSRTSLNPPSIYFDRPKKSTEKSDDEGNYKKIDVPIEAGNANSKNIEKRIRLFGDYDTSPEAWVKWRIELEEVIRDYPLESGEQKASMALALLKGSARDKFQQTWRRLDTENVAGPARQRKTPNEIFQLVMTEVGKAEPSKLSDDDLIQILNQAKPEEWQAVILGANIELYKSIFKALLIILRNLNSDRHLRPNVVRWTNPITLRARKGQLER